jgi:hypothetical protein
MLQINNTIISLDLLEKQFVCNLDKCLGECCIAGDSGAPLNDDEIDFLERNFDKIKPYMEKAGIEAIEENGIFWIDPEGEKVTCLVNGKECAFVKMNGKTANCAIEMAFNDKKIDFIKPISCHLYPVRIKEFKDFTAVNYDTWDICKPAEIYGKYLGVPVFRFLKEPLIRKFGEDWYEQLEIAYKNIDKLK